MNVLISHQLVMFTYLITIFFFFYQWAMFTYLTSNFFNLIHFIHVILLVGSNVGRYPKINNGYQRTTRFKYIKIYWTSVVFDLDLSFCLFGPTRGT